MNVLTREVEVKADLFHFVEETFDLQIHSSSLISRGWLNLKWRLETSRGMLFVKEFHPERYKHRSHALQEIRKALTIHARLHEQGLPCPRLYPVDGEYMLKTTSLREFVLMDFCSGNMIPAGQASVAQMFHLGQVTAQMHVLLNDTGDGDTSELYWQPSIEALRDTWQSYWEQAQQEQAPAYVLEALAKQRSVLDHLDLAQFAECERGWAHSDLWVDNILFVGEQTSAILDFDRLRYIYPELDVARAILSCALRDGQLNVDAVSAYIDGYRHVRSFARGGVARALKLIWCLESTWWVTPRRFDSEEVSVLRFAEEMMWLADQWQSLDDRFGRI